MFIVWSYEASRVDTPDWSAASRREETAMASDSNTPVHDNAANVRQAARLSCWMILFALRSTTDLLDHPEARRA